MAERRSAAGGDGIGAATGASERPSWREFARVGAHIARRPEGITRVLAVGARETRTRAESAAGSTETTISRVVL